MDAKILFVDDEEGVLSSLKRALLDEPFDVLCATSAQAGLAILENEPVTVVVSDERMPGMSGADFLAIVRERWPNTIRIMLTGQASVDAAMKVVNTGEIYRFFTKPWNDNDIILALRSALEKHELEEENRRLLRTVRRQSEELKHLEGRYPGISEVRRDSRGAVLAEVSDLELSEIIEECNKAYKG